MLCSNHHHRGSLLPWPLEQPPLPFNLMCLFAVRLPYVVCARSAWRCAPPCCLHARLCQRRILLPEASRLQKFFQKRLQLSRHGFGWSSTVLALCLGLQSASRTSSRVCGDTVFSVIILTSALHILSSLQNRNSSQIWGGRRGSRRTQQLAMPFTARVPTSLLLF